MIKSMILMIAKKSNVTSNALEVRLRAMESISAYPPKANIQKTNKKLKVETINPNLAFVRRYDCCFW